MWVFRQSNCSSFMYSRRNTDILAGNRNPELNLWGWADVQKQQLPHFTKQIKLRENCRRKNKKKTPFSVSIKTLLLFQSEAPATSRVDSSLSTFPLICEDLSWFSITALSFSSSHFLFTRSLTKLVSLSAVRLLPQTEAESVYSPDSVSALHWSHFLFCYSLIRTLTRLAHTRLKWSWIVLHFLSPCRTKLITIWLLHLWDYTHICILPVEIYSANLDVVYMFRVALSWQWISVVPLCRIDSFCTFHAFSFGAAVRAAAPGAAL